MATVTLLLLARVFHILGGVIWAGSMFALSFAIIPIGARHADEGAGRWTALAAREVGAGVGNRCYSSLYLVRNLLVRDAS